MSPSPRWCAVVVAFALCLCAPLEARAQGSAGSGAKLEPRFLVDMPTAGMPDKGSYAFDIDFYDEGGVLLRFTVGLLNRLSLGFSYGGSRLIGSEKPEMTQIPGVDLRFRVLEEGTGFPALVVGFDTQGKDGYDRGLSRYAVKSPGLFAVFSKNSIVLGFLSFHGGVSYSLERTDGDRDVNVFAGVEKTIGPFLSAVLEYNAAINENGGKVATRGRGYLNGAVRWSLGGGFTLGVSLKDLAGNRENISFARRTATIEFVHFF